MLRMRYVEFFSSYLWHLLPRCAIMKKANGRSSRIYDKQPVILAEMSWRKS